MASQHQPDYDVITIGAGFAGLGLIHYIREAGLSIRVAMISNASVRRASPVRIAVASSKAL